MIGLASKAAPVSGHIADANISAPPPRLDGVDALRGLSIVLVVLHHINLHMRFSHLSFEPMLPRMIARALFWDGAQGVTIFFAVSGFLITSNSLRRWGTLGNVRAADFYRLRVARIAPLLCTLLAALSLLHLLHAPGFTIAAGQATLGRALLAALTFHVNWLESARGYLPANWDVLWSLSVEEVFYLFFPLLCLTLRRPRLLASALAGFILVAPLARVRWYGQSLWADYGYLSCMDAIALGCLTAMLAPRLPRRPRLLLGLQLTGAAMMMLVMVARPLARQLHLYQSGLDTTVLALGSCLVLIAVSLRQRPGSLLTAPLRWFGRNSYEVYLTHMFVATWGIQLCASRGLPLAWSPLAYLAMLLLAGALGALVARFYSEPLNRLLRRPMIGPAVL